ncbi:uncharacterized protein LOC142238010 [Haematobia irritans]|uniref:uncharacterized protein LOC142238010 n=1 Tax=Haematobia irritans TaxID=7368 RepID=UPI003F50999C
MLSSSSSNTSTMTYDASHHQQRLRRRQLYHQQENHRHMGSFYGPNRWLWTAVLFGLLIVIVSAKDEVCLKYEKCLTGIYTILKCPMKQDLDKLSHTERWFTFILIYNHGCNSSQK